MSNTLVVATPGLECRPRFEHLPRHRHARAYAAVVLAGDYEEAGEHGRLHVAAGEVLLHGAFEAHLNRIGARGARILNVELPDCVEPRSPVAMLKDPDVVVRLARHDPVAAAHCLLHSLLPATPHMVSDWPDQLARDLIGDPALRLGAWARAHQLAAATVSRGFRQVYGLTPAAFRAQVRGRQAWRSIIAGGRTLADLAVAYGFADQAHMTRTVRSITGRPAGAWRRSTSN